ncbi:unnamed protein product [Arabidopsis lyrata]|nr:unnamed protein product [Arabidopsis lyrata]
MNLKRLCRTRRVQTNIYRNLWREYGNPRNSKRRPHPEKNPSICGKIYTLRSRNVTSVEEPNPGESGINDEISEPEKSLLFKVSRSEYFGTLGRQTVGVGSRSSDPARKDSGSIRQSGPSARSRGRKERPNKFQPSSSKTSGSHELNERRVARDLLDREDSKRKQ